MRSPLWFLASVGVVALAGAVGETSTQSPAALFFASLSALCGRAFGGRIIANQPLSNRAGP